MSFARLPTQAPQFDATALMNSLKAPATLAKQFVTWKRWTEATTEFDGTGLRDVVNANALALNQVKADVDTNKSRVSQLEARVAAVEARPGVPFPGSGLVGAGSLVATGRLQTLRTGLLRTLSGSKPW